MLKITMELGSSTELTALIEALSLYTDMETDRQRDALSGASGEKLSKDERDKLAAAKALLKRIG
jgi:ABC-type transport system involved in cytochrome bd biosynthesis fused ATPase/permease subunit